jgi:hypothetical protein
MARLASVTGSLQVPEYYDYGVEADGSGADQPSAPSPAAGHALHCRASTVSAGQSGASPCPGFNNGEAFSGID